MSLFKSYSSQQSPMPQISIPPAELVVWKYRLNPNGPAQIDTVDMPHGAKVLTVGMQNDALTLWALSDPAAARVPRRFVVVGTGFKIPTSDIDLSAMEFVGTIDNDGRVWHVFIE